MTGKISKVEIQSTFTVNRRQLEILHHLTSYSNKDWVKGMRSSISYHGGVSEQEMVSCLEELNQVTAQLMAYGNKIELFKEN